MAAAKYTYRVSEDFPEGVVAPSRLLAEIRSSAIVTAADYINTASDDCDVWFKAELSATDESILDALVAAHSGEPLPDCLYESDGTMVVNLKTKQDDGIPVLAQAPRVGSEWVVGTHNFADKCSWFGDSVRVVDEVLSPSIDFKTYSSDHENWIDMISGRVHMDDVWVQLQQALNPDDPHGYSVVVKVDGVVKTMRAPFATSGGDYEILWDDGAIVFFSSQFGKTVTVSYSYATTSTFYLRPLPGTVLRIEHAVADISEDVVMRGDITYGVWKDDGQGGKEMESCAVFKRAGQIMTEASAIYPVIVAVGASTSEKLISNLKEFRRKSRGMWANRQTVAFQYETTRRLFSSGGDELRVFLGGDDEFGGSHASMTFYCTEVAE